MPKISPARLNHSLIRSVLVLVIPGLSLKRWLALGAIGLVAVGLGVAFALQIPLGPGFRSFVGTASFRDSSPLIRGGVFIGVGAAIAGAAAFMLARSLSKAWLRRRHWSLLDSLYVERVLGAGPKVVAIGGGTGLPTLLRGLKNYTSNITAEGKTPPNQSLVPIQIKRARHNYYFVIRSGDYGVHNAPYAKHLINVANDEIESLNVGRPLATRANVSQAEKLRVIEADRARANRADMNDLNN